MDDIIKLVRQLADSGNLDEAERELTAALEQNPGSTELLKLQAELSFKTGSLMWDEGEVDRALDYLTQALDIDPYDRNVVLKCAEVLSALEQHDAARNLYSNYLLKNPADEEVSEALRSLPAAPEDTGPRDAEIRVSAIVSTYNSERFMRGCLEDLVNQTLYKKGELEIIVIDSGSEENEKAIVEEFQKTYENIIYVRTKRETVYAAWNRGIKLASGKYITNANTDDRRRRDALEVMAYTLDHNPGIGLVYADVIITEKENETFENHTEAGFFRWLDYSRELLTLGCFMGPQPMWRKSLHDKYGFFDESFSSSGDWEFWLRIAEGTEFLHMHDLLGLYLRSAESVEHRNERRVEEDLRVLKTYVPRYLSTVEEVEKGLAAVRKVEYRLSGLLDFMKKQLLQQKAHILGEKYTPVEAVMTEADLMVPVGEPKDVSYRQKTPGLASIIILLSDHREFPKRSSESIRKHTKEPFEIIFVPLKASYSPPKWLRRMMKENSNYKLAPSPATVSSTTPGKNRLTYAQACNLGIAKASGEYIVVMDDGVIVTEGWLTGMLECLKMEKDAGIVGPMTDNCEGRQRVLSGELSVDSGRKTDLKLEEHAKAFRQRNRYRRVPVKKLSGFCLLFSHELIEKSGTFDERFVSMDYSTQDFSLRASLEGYASVIAGDVFLHRMNAGGEAFALQTKDKQTYAGKWSNIGGPVPFREKLVVINTIAAADGLAQAGQVNMAASALIEGMKHSSGDKRLDYALVGLLIENKRHREGLDILENMPEEFGQDSQKLVLTGYCKEALELYEEADEYADKALVLDNASPKAWNLKGAIAFKRGQNAEAEQYFQNAMEADRGFGEAYANRGALRWVAGEKEEAFRLFEKAFILSPTSEDIVINYYTAAGSLSKLADARKIFEEAVSLHPENRRLRFILTDNLLQQGENEEAMKLLEDALLLFGTDDNTLSAALALRERLGPMETGKTESPAVGGSQKSSVIARSKATRQSNGVERDRIATFPPVARNDKKETSISLCMIVKNEERTIGKCLAAIKPVVDEMIVVDTGSADRTKDIAKAFGAKVYDFAWTDSFSDARNFSLSKASGDWILVLDADEVISPQDQEKLRELMEKGSRGQGFKDSRAGQKEKRSADRPREFSSSDAVAYSFVSRNYVVPVSINWHANDGVYKEEAGSGWFPSEKVRLFPNDRRIRFEKPVHETVEDSLLKTGIRFRRCDIPIHHYGKLNKKDNQEKGEAYYQLGKKKLAEQGKIGPQALYELAIQAFELEKFDESLECWERLAGLQPDFAEAYHGMGMCYFKLGRYEEALSAFRKARELDPKSKDPVVLYATSALCAGNAETAIAHLDDLLRKEPFYPLALLAMTTACFCAGRNKTGIAYAEKVRQTGFVMAPYMNDIAKLLIQARLFDYARRLLEAAVETGNTTDETQGLLEEIKNKETGGDSSRLMETYGKDKTRGVKITDSERNRHPREGGGPFNALKSMDSRLRGNDELRADVSSLNQSQQVSVSLCMIVMNEEENIERALLSVKPVVDEMIVVDTGSTDRTKDIAAALGAKVYDFPWTDDFSEARNFSLSKASGDCILVLDADEVISPLDYAALMENVMNAKSGPRAYTIVTRNYVNLSGVGCSMNEGIYSEEAGSGWFPSDKVRLFPNDSRIRFENPVHELVDPSIKRYGIECIKSGVVVHHYGKLDRVKSLIKGETYYNLGKRKFAEQGGTDLQAAYELAVQASELGKHNEALDFWKRLTASQPGFAPAFIGMATSFFRLGRYEEAISSLDRAMELDPDSADASVMYSLCKICLGEAEIAVSVLEELIKRNPGYSMAIFPLASAYYCSGNKEKGLEYLSKLKTLNYTFAGYFTDMAKLLISGGRPGYAVLLLEALRETDSVTDETILLLSECRKMVR